MRIETIKAQDVHPGDLISIRSDQAPLEVFRVTQEVMEVIDGVYPGMLSGACVAIDYANDEEDTVGADQEVRIHLED